MQRKRINEMVRQLKESVSVDETEYMNNSKGKLPKGRGLWVFCSCDPKDNKDIDYGNDQEVFRYTGLYTQAKREAQKWAQSLRKRTSVIYVLG